jgi:LEA14-like dessication related protein
MRVVIENIMMHCGCTQESAEDIDFELVYDYSKYPEGWHEAVDEARKKVKVEWAGGLKREW